MEQYVLRGPADLVAATPYLLGYQPADSMVVMAFQERRVLAVARADLAKPAGAPSLEGLDDALDPMSGQGATTMAFLGYGLAAQVDPVVPLVQPAAERHGLQVIDVLRVDDGRWWSYTCELGCCPSEGTRFDPVTIRLAAGCAAAGLVVWPSRTDLEQQVAPIGGPARASMSRATDSAVRRFAALAGMATARPGRDSWEARVLVRARRAVQTALTHYEQGGHFDDGQMAWLSVLLHPT